MGQGCGRSENENSAYLEVVRVWELEHSLSFCGPTMHDLYYIMEPLLLFPRGTDEYERPCLVMYSQQCNALET